MARNRKSKGGVEWFLPNRKRPFAHSTAATSLLIQILATRHNTWSDVAAAINYDPEAKAICDRFIDAGHGGAPARTSLGIVTVADMVRDVPDEALPGHLMVLARGGLVPWSLLHKYGIGIEPDWSTVVKEVA